MSEIDKPYIESRIADWIQRIDDLYTFVKGATDNINGIKYKKNKKVVMHEGLMQNFHVTPVDLPILDIYKEQKLVMSFKPIGLWVLGANGRIDILTQSGAYILVDIAEKNNKPEWEVFSPAHRTKGQHFDSNFIQELVSSE